MSNERETDLPLQGTWIAKVRTFKGRTGCKTTVTVGKKENQTKYSTFTVRMFTDFSQTVVETTRRCTEKVVNAQHEIVLSRFDAEYLPLIQQHYENDAEFHA